MRLNHATVPCGNVAESVEFYRKLGLIQIVASDHYARFVCPDGDTTLSVHAVDEIGKGAAPVVCFERDDLDRTVAELEAAGIALDSQPEDKRWLRREARLHDPAGSEVCLYHAGVNRLNPPWRISPPEWSDP
jgi:catechol 2,3-dioxygenase-like lactoylglutathione lyase family enzyme